MSIITKYKFDQTIYENFIPEFDSGFTYTITDEIDTDGYTIRTIESDSLPQRIKFGETAATYTEKGIQSLIEILFVDIRNGMTNFNGFLANAINLISVNTDGWDTSEIVSMQSMFYNCSSLTSLNLSNFNTEKVTNMGWMFYNCSSLTSLDVSNFNVEKVTNMNQMFQNCSSLTSLDLSNFNTQNVTDMTAMFNLCSKLTSLDISNFNTQKVPTMQNMFANCSSLTSLDVSSFNTSQTTNMFQMFSGCTSLTSLDLSNFNTEKVTIMKSMFQNCSSLTSLDVSSFNTENVMEMSYMFQSTSSLTSLDVSNFNTQNVTNMSYIFGLCKNLVVLDISNFNILPTTTTTDMFNNVGINQKLDIGAIHCNDATITHICNCIGSDSRRKNNATVWHTLNEDFSYEGYNLQRYQSTTLSLNEPIQLRSIGDVHDEINYETGEYIQRIGEIVFDGSEDEGWSARVSNVDGSSQYRIDAGINIRAGKYKGHLATDKFITSAADSSNVLARQCGNVMFRPDNSIYDIELFISNDRLNGNELKQWLSENPITVFYVLAEPIISTVDHTILDQNNSYKSFQQTYDEQTYVSVQSDTVVTPTSSVDYEIYSSTGTVTGTSATIDNAEAGTPVSGVVYGETLLNVIQEPSEDEFVCIDSFSGKEVTIENSVAGNLKDVIIKGQSQSQAGQALPTNIFNNWENKTGTYTPTHTQDGYFLFTGDNIDIKVNLNDIPTFKRNVEYTFIFRIKNSTYHGRDGNILRMDFGSTILYTDDVKTGIWKTKMSFSTSATNCYVRAYALPGATGSAEVSLQIIEGDYTNQDIPYFESIGSVTNYCTIENMQSTCTYSENNGTYWCDTTTVNPTVGKRYFIKIFNNPNNAITRFFYGGVIVDTTTDYGIVTATDRTGMRLHFYNLKNGTVTITEEQKNAIRFLICEYQDGMENWEINEHFEESYTVQMPILKTTGKNLFNPNRYTWSQGSLNDAGNPSWSAEPSFVTALTPIEEFPIKQGETAYLTCTLSTDKWTQVFFYDNTKARIGRALNHGQAAYLPISVTVPANASYFRIHLGTENVETGTMTYKRADCVANIGYTENTVTVNENIELNSIGDVYDELNVTTGELTKYVGIDENSQPYLLDIPVIEKVNVTIIDQDNIQQKYVQTYDTITHLKPQSYGLIPTVEYKAPTYDVLLKENTQYTIKLNRTNIVEGTPLTVNLGGTELSIEDSADSFTITTPSTLTNNTLSIGGTNNKVKEVMVIEGDWVDRDLDFFEGFVNVENPMVQIYNDNIWGKLLLPPATIESFETDYAAYITTKKPILVLKPNTRYIINANITTKEQIVANLQEITENGTARNLSVFNITGTGRIAHDFDTTNGEVYLNFYPGYNDEDIKMVFDLLEQTNFTVCEYSKYENNINTVIEKKSNTLTTYPQITLRSIGDIKDEWDVVGETVTRRIGEVVLDGNSGYHSTLFNINNNTIFMQWFDGVNQKIPNMKINSKLLCDRLPNLEAHLTDIEGIDCHVVNGNLHFNISKDKLIGYNLTFEGVKQYLNDNPLSILYELETPVTESVRITPPNPQTSTASITIPTQLNHVEDTSDFLVWNPYKEHYVRYNYVEDGVVLDNYTWENLTDLNERQFVEFYNKRTYIDQPYHNYVASHDSKGTSKYVLIEPNQDYTVSVRFSELPTCETVKVNLGGAEVEMNVNDPHVHVTTPNTLVNNLCSISGDGLDGKVTDILVIHCLEHEGFADIEYFEGIDGIGEIVEVEGVPKSKIVVEQTNGNLLDFEPVVFNNGNYISIGWDDKNKSIPIHQNKEYVFKLPKRFDNEWGDYGLRLYDSNFNQTRTISISSINNWRRFIFTPTVDEKYIRMFAQFSSYGETHCHVPVELCYTNMEKDYIRPRYYDKEEILLPIQLHRINTVYDNFYYDEMKGYYRIQQSIGHKYFVGADSENWTLIERGQRVLRFRYNNADIQMKSLGEFMTNRLPNGTATSPYECCAFNGINFIVSIDKERLSSESLTAFKEWLANNNLHLYYQLASPLMIDLPEYSSRIEFNTYKDEIYTFFKNCKPTVFTLAVPLDQTYRFYELEQGEGYANRVELTDERMTEEDTLYINTIYGSGISNLIEEPNNVDTMLKPNYEGKATSHSLTNGKVSTIGVHGFEPNNVTISNYNTVTKQYELTVQAQQGTNTNTKVLPIPYKFEVYEDGTKDRVHYNSQYKQWMFEGGQTLTVPYNTSTGAFTNAIEVFRGLQPRSGLIGEFKVRFTSGTTSVRLYYSINGTTYGYTTLRDMTDGVDYYIGFFNTGGSKIDMGTKIDANAEYTKLVPINGTIPECLMINQIQNITECTYYQDKTYYYSDVVSPLLLDVYNGETIITELNGAVIDIQNNAHNKQALIYGDTTYTVYWTYVGGEGNIKVTLGGTTQEVVATQGYVTITTSDTDLEKGLFIGGFNVTIKDLMLVKGERITDLKYFEGSRAVGTAFTDENGETMYKITLVTGSELINDKFEEIITFEDNKKHNVVVTKLLGAKPDKI